MPPVSITPLDQDENATSLTQEGIDSTLPKNAPGRIDSSLTNSITATPPNELADKAQDVVEASLAELNACKMTCTYTSAPRPVPAIGSAEMASQKVCTDHMVQAKWTAESGWEAPTLQPSGPLSLAPTASCLHYATECFEGMKLYRGHDSKLRLFRPDLNCRRMLMSTNRIALPAFDPEELLKLVIKLCITDGKKWLPKDRPGQFLYIRPAMIASDPSLGIEQPKEALLFIILCCFAHMGDLSGGIKLLASQDDMCRAWPVVSEAGASNFFVVWKNKDSKVQLVTADLNERIVLDGITRRSILELARDKLTSSATTPEDLETLEVVECKFNILRLRRRPGRAVLLRLLLWIHFRGKDIDIPMAKGKFGAYADFFKSSLKGIMWGCDGLESHEWGRVIDEE
ncbi:Branched-chain-amino-acid aminotransferase [Pyrenophora tritici-repentis]|nr:Branched-chain-amino-acid aminotransferase [Pyrenophora tritici-repentis]